jgi:hypothetical protein
LFVLFALGCSAKPSGPTHYASDGAYGGSGGYGGDYGGEADYAYSDDLAPAGSAAPMAPPPDRLDREESRSRPRFKEVAKNKDKLESKPSPDTATTTATDSVEQEPPPPPEVDDPVPSHGRQIIYTAGMGLSVFDVADVMVELEAIPERHGGWMHQRYDNSVILRVPAAKLDVIIKEIAGWGVVEWKTLEALDVTAEYTDLDSRIRVLEQMQGHLKDLLARAENVEQALEIQVELAKVTAELEMLRAQMRMLDSSIAFSTLAVELRERGTVEPEPGDDPFPWVDQLGAEATAYR